MIIPLLYLLSCVIVLVPESNEFYVQGHTDFPENGNLKYVRLL